MRFSVWVSSGHSWDEVLGLSAYAETAGWDGVWIPDHFMPPERGYGNEVAPADDPELGPVHEAWTLAAAVAGLVRHIRIGVLVSGNTYRHPAVVAKMAATIDHISGGRFLPGLGAGWQENEHRRYGIPFPTAAERSDRLEEAAAVISSLLGHRGRSTVEGMYYQLTEAPLEPKPVQSPMPLLIGGKGERRTIRTAARYATHWNCWGTPQSMDHKIGVLAQHCADAGRGTDEIEVSTNAFLHILEDPVEGETRRAEMGERGGLVGTPSQIRAQVEAYAGAGVDEIVIAGFNYPPREFRNALTRLGVILAGNKR